MPFIPLESCQARSQLPGVQYTHVLIPAYRLHIVGLQLAIGTGEQTSGASEPV